MFLLQKEINSFNTYYFMRILFILTCLSLNTFACDICGCFMGITPYDNQSQVSLYHRYRVFNGYRSHEQKGVFFPAGAYKVMHGGNDSLLPVGYTKKYSTNDFESYKVFELRAKYFIHNRIELNAIIPLNSNKSKEDSIYKEHVGLGDPTFFVGYHLIKRVNYEKFQNRLIVGSGVKLPSGNYYAKDENNTRLPFLMQPGTGSVDGFFYLNYLFGYRKFGFSINSVYKVNGQNFYKERVANSTSNYLNLFFKFKVNDFIFIPAIQSYYENTKGLYINSQLQKGTAMNCLLTGPGLDLYYKNISFSTAFQFKAYEKLDGDNLNSKGRLVIGLTYNFNQRKYLLRKREEAD